MGIQLKNNASGTLATAINASDTGIVLTTGNGANFPSLGALDYFYATLESTGGTSEIIKVTVRSGDSMTVVRAQEGTSAQSFAAGSRIELRVTAASVNDRVIEAQAYTDTLRSDLAASSGSSLVGFLQAGASAVPRTVQSRLREYVSVIDFGADASGTADSSAAFQAAVNTGKAVYIPQGTYKILTPIIYVGQVQIFGDGYLSRILSDSVVFDIRLGTGSTIDNLYLENITAPWIITRDVNNWTAPVTPVQSNADGYQPTANDVDIWSSLTTAQKTQDIGPYIRFSQNATDIQVSRIYGRFVNIQVQDARRSVVRDCDIRGGKNFGAGIMFWNIDAQSGNMNSAINNRVRYASFCGIMMANNFDGLMMGNRIEYCGESGLKTYQGDVAGNNARCYNMQIIGNYTKYNYYDGIDISSEQPVSAATDTRYQVIGNHTFGNRMTGFVGDGRNNQIVGNRARFNGLDGFILDIGYSLFSNNYAIDNNKSNPVSGHHEMNIGGENNTIANNYIQHDPANTGYAIYATGNGHFISGNRALGASFFFGSIGASTSVIDNNIGPDTTFGSSVRMGKDGAIEQTATGVPAMRLYNTTSAFDNVDQVFHPRRQALANPIAAVRGLLTYGISGAENGWLQMFAAQNGALVKGLALQTSNSFPGKAWPVLTANNAAPVSGDMQNGSVVFYLDEAGNNLKVTVKYSDGTVKTGTLAVV